MVVKSRVSRARDQLKQILGSLSEARRPIPPIHRLKATGPLTIG